MQDGNESLESGTNKLRKMTPEELLAAAMKQGQPLPSTISPEAVVSMSLLPPVHNPRRIEFSVITCSPPQNAQKYEQMERNYKLALAGEDYEIIKISDAKSMAEGYNRGIQQAKGNILIFTHDDAFPLRSVAGKLRGHLRRVDIVGGAGSDRLDGPAWFTAGPPHVFGQVLNARPAQVQMPDGKVIAQQPLLLTIYNVPSRLVEGIQVLDGFWIATNRRTLDIGFNEVLCDTFHMYDIDFSYRAYCRGLKVGVATDLSLAHASSGGYGDPKWKPAADKWMEKYGELLPSHPPIDFQLGGVAGSDLPHMLNLMDGLVARTFG